MPRLYYGEEHLAEAIDNNIETPAEVVKINDSSCRATIIVPHHPYLLPQTGG